MADYVLNDTNEVNRKDYGIRVARPGYNALTCADNQLLFNSNWPILQIVDVDKEELLETVGSVSDEAIFLYTEEKSNTPCAVNDTNVVSRQVDDYYFDNDEIKTVSKKYGCKHTLGYPPLAFSSGDLSEVTGYVVITSINISEDVDYPYTAAPLAYEGASNDYGIKSKAFYNANMPREGEKSGFGINTNLSSKLVEAVKTLDSAHSYTVGQDTYKYVTWAPPKDDDGNFISNFEDFEYFAFAGNSGYYDPGYALFFPSGSSISQAECVRAQFGGQSGSTNPALSSLVVLRQPMISPTIVEVTYGV